jgi:hypothetical protein
VRPMRSKFAKGKMVWNETPIPDALAQAAVIAYLNLRGREAEAEEVSRVTNV